MERVVFGRHAVGVDVVSKEDDGRSRAIEFGRDAAQFSQDGIVRFGFAGAPDQDDPVRYLFVGNTVGRSGILVGGVAGIQRAGTHRKRNDQGQGAQEMATIHSLALHILSLKGELTQPALGVRATALPLALSRSRVVIAGHR